MFFYLTRAMQREWNTLYIDGCLSKIVVIDLHVVSPVCSWQQVFAGSGWTSGRHNGCVDFFLKTRLDSNIRTVMCEQNWFYHECAHADVRLRTLTNSPDLQCVIGGLAQFFYLCTSTIYSHKLSMTQSKHSILYLLSFLACSYSYNETLEKKHLSENLLWPFSNKHLRVFFLEGYKVSTWKLRQECVSLLCWIKLCVDHLWHVALERWQ